MKNAKLLCIAGLSLGLLALRTAIGQPVRILEPVRLTNEQALLLKQAAGGIAARKQTAGLKLKEFEPTQSSQARTLLFDALFREEKEVYKIQETFDKLANTDDARLASRVFFGDILNLYSGGGRNLKDFAVKEYPLARKNTFELFDYTQTAYTFVAQRGFLTFDLDVRSSPPQAQVTFRRRGDAAYTTHSSVTNTTLKNLVYAAWQVRAELKGYSSQEKIYDPFRESSNSLDFALHK